MPRHIAWRTNGSTAWRKLWAMRRKPAWWPSSTRITMNPTGWTSPRPTTTRRRTKRSRTRSSLSGRRLPSVSPTRENGWCSSHSMRSRTAAGAGAMLSWPILPPSTRSSTNGIRCSWMPSVRREATTPPAGSAFRAMPPVPRSPSPAWSCPRTTPAPTA